MLNKKSKIFVAGHKGMVGSAILKLLVSKGYKNIVFRTSAELDLRVQNKVSNFFVSKEPVIDVTVLIHEEILPKITGNEVLFVYARRSNGMRVPLAIDIYDVTLKKNSYNVKLDNTMNMLENQTLSSAEEVIIEARISKTKRAMVIPGDFIGISKPIKLKILNEE